MKKTDDKQKVDEFFKNLKEFMKTRGRQIRFAQFLRFQRGDQGLLVKLIEYIFERIRTHERTQILIQQELKRMLTQRKNLQDQFRVQKSSITFISKYQNVIDQTTLLKQIQKYPKGLTIDDQLMRLTYDGIKQTIRSIIHRRKVLFIKTKQLQKSKNQDNFIGYILYAYPEQIKQYAPNLFKISNADLEKQILKQRKLQRRYALKTQQFKDVFEKSCRENFNKLLMDSRLQIQTKQKKVNSQWEDINRSCIPNYDQLIEEHIKKMNNK